MILSVKVLWNKPLWQGFGCPISVTATNFHQIYIHRNNSIWSFLPFKSLYATRKQCHTPWFCQSKHQCTTPRRHCSPMPCLILSTDCGVLIVDQIYLVIPDPRRFPDADDLAWWQHLHLRNWGMTYRDEYITSTEEKKLALVWFQFDRGSLSISSPYTIEAPQRYHDTIAVQATQSRCHNL
jgi:hypothetical protein